MIKLNLHEFFRRNIQKGIFLKQGLFDHNQLINSLLFLNSACCYWTKRVCEITTEDCTGPPLLLSRLFFCSFFSFLFDDLRVGFLLDDLFVVFLLDDLRIGFLLDGLLFGRLLFSLYRYLLR